VTGLAAIVESHPQYAAQHQMAVMDCLEDPDETLQRKTLDLLYKLVNPVNVEFITDKLLDFLRKTTDTFLKRILTTRICSVAERYAPDNAWYIRTITTLFEISGDMVRPEVAQNLMSLIAEGTGESEEDDMLLRQNAVEIYANLLLNTHVAKLPRILLETMAWCLGEYGYLSAVASLDEIMMQLCALTRKHKAKLAPTTRKFLLGAIMKLVAQAGTCPPHAAAVIDDFTRSGDVDLQQRCLEFQNLLTSAANVLGDVLPVDASCEDVDVDVDLSFLDGYVHEALTNGAKEYSKPDDDDDDDDYMYEGGGGGASGSSAFKMGPYEKPQIPTASSLSGMRSGNAASASGISLPPGSGYHASGGGAGTGSVNANGELQLNVRNVANVWGKGGLAAGGAPPPAPAPVATATAGSFDSSGGAAYGGSSSAFGSSGFGAPAPAAEPEKPKELTEKEKMAAALFGGVVPGANPPPPRSSPPKPPTTTTPAVPAPAAAAPPPPAPAPAPEIDLLDMMAFDDAPASAPAVSADLDVFAPQPLEPMTATAPPPAGAAPLVETVSDDEEEAAAPAPVPVNLDPFADMGETSDAPLASFQVDNRFEYIGSKMAPLEITTAQFGQHWGSCTATSPANIAASKVDTLDKFLQVCESLGAHKVEAISATNEGIAAGMVNGTNIALIHGKITPLGIGNAKVDITIKSTDATMSGCLAVAIQNMMR